MQIEKLKRRFTVKSLDELELKKYFDEFVSLFSENTRGHIIDQDIDDEYILQKSQELLLYLERQEAILLGLFSENEFIGFLWAYPTVFLEESRIFINSLIIKNGYRGMGGGAILMREIELIAHQKKIPSLYVSTASFKKEAISFYHSLGYQDERVQLRKSISQLDYHG